jgi:hypothetical protein
MKIRLPLSACLNCRYAISPINARAGDKIVMRQIFLRESLSRNETGSLVGLPLPSRYNGIIELA